MKNLFLTAVAIAIVIAIGSAVKPYWDKYWIQKELEIPPCTARRIPWRTLRYSFSTN